MAKIQITSPVRPITSGKAPTKDTLAKGQIAVGAVSGEQCIYINPDGTQVVDALKDVKAKITSEKNTTAAAIDSLNSKVNGINNSKGAANGIATLDASGKVPSAQLPSYVDDVLEFANKAAFPATGESGKIYIAIDTNKSYRWSGSAYTEISKSLALGETASTAYAGNKGKANADAIAAIRRDKYVKPTGWEIDSTGNNFAQGEVAIDGGEGAVGTAQLGDGVNIRCEAGEAIVNSAVAGTKSTVLTIPNATASKNGMMSASDKEYLDKVKSDSYIDISVGVVDASKAEIDYDMILGGTNVSEHTFALPVASSTTAGIITAADKKNIDESITTIFFEDFIPYSSHEADPDGIEYQEYTNGYGKCEMVIYHGNKKIGGNSFVIPIAGYLNTTFKKGYFPGLLEKEFYDILNEIQGGCAISDIYMDEYGRDFLSYEIDAVGGCAYCFRIDAVSVEDDRAGLMTVDDKEKLDAIPAPETILTEVELVVETI